MRWMEDRAEEMIAAVRHGRGIGVETDVPTAFVAEFRDGLCRHAKDYREARLPLEAAGLAD